MKQQIYADNAATTKLNKSAFKAMIPWLCDEYANASQPYAFSRNAKNALRESREIIASCIGASPEEIFFTSGGTESNNWAIKGTVLSQTKKKRVLMSAIEHHAVLNTRKSLEPFGYIVSNVSATDTGTITVSALDEIIDENVCTTSIMLANNEIGTIQPIKRLSEIAHKYGSLFHTDAVQAVGHISIDVRDLDVDLLSASAHKFGGPKGIGFLYIKKGTHTVPFMDGGSQEQGLRAGTENVASIVGMATALRISCDKIEENDVKIRSFVQKIIDELHKEEIDFIVNGSETKLPGILSLSFGGKEGEAILHQLDLLGISVSTGSACDSVNTQVSHVLKAIDLNAKYAKGTIRISFGPDNTDDDVTAIISALKKVIQR